METAMNQKKSTVLIIEDEPPIRKLLTIMLEGKGYKVVECDNGKEGTRLAASVKPDLILVDLGLPDMDGKEVVEAIRGWSQVPIIVLSAREAEQDKVAALDLGADDYLVKPFGMDELLARIRVALRHAARLNAAEEPVLTFDALTIDRARRRVLLQGREVHLTPTEYELLQVLASHAGKVLTHQMILRKVWGPNSEQDLPTLRVFITQLRRKVEPDPSRPSYILTEPGIGYRFQGRA